MSNENLTANLARAARALLTLTSLEGAAAQFAQYVERAETGEPVPDFAQFLFDWLNDLQLDGTAHDHRIFSLEVGLRELREVVDGFRPLMEQRTGHRERSLAGGLVLGLAAEMTQNPEVRVGPALVDATFISYRAAMEAIDSAVIPLLGRLTAEYCNKPLDPFFRGAVRTLRDFTAGDLAALRRIVHVASLAPEAEGSTSVHVEVNTRHGIPVTVHAGRSTQRLEEASNPLPRGVFVSAPTAWFRVWSLLEGHHLAKQDSATVRTWEGAPANEPAHRFFLVFDRVTVDRLRAVLGADAELAAVIAAHRSG